jgi:hypothetical protein
LARVAALGCGLNRSTQHFNLNASLQNGNDAKQNSNRSRRNPQIQGLTLQEVLPRKSSWWNPPKLKQLWLQRGKSPYREGDWQVGLDLVVGSGGYEPARQAPDRTPRSLTRSIGFSSFNNYKSGGSKQLAAIQTVVYLLNDN